MNKPLSVAYEDFKQSLLTIINNSGLPMCMMEVILQNYLNEVKLLSQRQYQLELAEYEKQLQAENVSE